MLIYNSVITEAVMRTWLHGQAVKTLASHAGIRGSIPLGVTFERVSDVYKSQDDVVDTFRNIVFDKAGIFSGNYDFEMILFFDFL